MHIDEPKDLMIDGECSSPSASEAGDGGQDGIGHGPLSESPSVVPLDPWGDAPMEAADSTTVGAVFAARQPVPIGALLTAQS